MKTAMNPVTSFLVFLRLFAGMGCAYWVNAFLAIPLFLLAALVAASLQMANLWQKFVILRIGKLQSVRGAGMFVIIPVLDSVVAVIEQLIQTTASIICWNATDAEKAALAITNYREAIGARRK